MDTATSRPLGRLVVVGVGLIGGSCALALRAANAVREVVGVGRSRANLEEALARGIVDRAWTLDEPWTDELRHADVVLVATPVAQIAPILSVIAAHAGPGTVVTDAGSTKGDVVAAARWAFGARIGRFVPAHPIAGMEGSGVHHADAGLYSGRHVILTPLPQTAPPLVQRASDVWSAIGAQVLKMTPDNHDGAFAAVSHLPHLLAFAYFGSVLGQPAGRDLLSLAGPGFRDFTRIAAGDPAMWRDVLLANREEVLKQSQRFRQSLDALEEVMRAGNGAALHELLRVSSDGRRGWQMGSLGSGSRNGAGTPTGSTPAPST